MPKILLVEDDPLIGRALTRLLTQEGFSPQHVTTLSEGRKAYREGLYDLVILDVNLPDGLGFELCREIREEDGEIPILFLTARGDEETAVKGLSAGACDFVRKPFPRQELILRIRKALKNAPDRLSVGELSVDRQKHEVKWKGKTIKLTPSEFEVLSILLEKSGNIVSLERLVERLDPEGEMMEKSVKSHLSRLKAKLVKAKVESVRIEAIYGQGYKLERA